MRFSSTTTLERVKGLNRLNPFKDYGDFLNFVNEEYQTLGEPEDYAEHMKFFEDVYAEREYINSKYDLYLR